MRLVLDTNVLVAGILSASGPPGWIVEALLSGEIEPVLDIGIRAEYEDVLERPELSLEPERVAAVLDVIDAFGFEALAPPWPETLPDPDDAPFLAVAAFDFLLSVAKSGTATNSAVSTASSFRCTFIRCFSPFLMSPSRGLLSHFKMSISTRRLRFRGIQSELPV